MKAGAQNGDEPGAMKVFREGKFLLALCRLPRKFALLIALFLLLAGGIPLDLHAEESRFAPPPHTGTWEQFTRVISLRDYNTRVVLLGTTLLGISGGLVGVFLLLRRRSLTADVVSHATLPGIAIAYLVLESFWPGTGKSVPGLLAGAFVAGLVGLGCVTLILRQTRIKEDAALAIVLSVFFGLGVSLFTVIQSLPNGNAAGLGHFIYGKAASMVAADVKLIGWMSIAVLIVFLLLFKEFKLLTFDEPFAAAQGWPVLGLDVLLLILVTTVTVIGLQSVGMLLVVALMIIPAAAARFWTHNLKSMAIISATIGGLSSMLGVLASAMFPRLAAGAVIVIAGSALFLVSLFCGRPNGVIFRAVSNWVRNRDIGRMHLLRAFYEILEPRCLAGDLPEQMAGPLVSFAELLAHRSWSPSRLRRLLRSGAGEGLVLDYGDAGYKLTERGAEVARRVVRNHRLWELYLIEFADREPSRVDRDADDIEHHLDPEIVLLLERLLRERYPVVTQTPPSPHQIALTAPRNPS